jgi:signal transduction histidine kinase
LESSADAQEKIKDLIWTVNPDEDGLGKFFIKFNRYASDLLDAKEINYNINLPNDSVNQTISMEKRQHLWCICKEVLTNIARHSQCKNVFIKIEYIGKRLELYFEDDGIGFDESVKKYSNGLVNIKNRAETLGASYNLITGKDRGTKWSFSITI